MKNFCLLLFLALGFATSTTALIAQEKASGAAGKAAAAAAARTEHYSHRSKKLDRIYYLFSKDVKLKNSDKIRTIYYFAKDPKNPKGKPVAKVPEGKVVSETKTGMLVLKNKK